MNFTQTLFEALESLTSNKMRSGLTILGIVIGVAAVIAMLAVGRGAQASINNSISSIGTNLLFISSGAQGVTRIQPLTLADCGITRADLERELDLLVANALNDTQTVMAVRVPESAELRRLFNACFDGSVVDF